MFTSFCSLFFRILNFCILIAVGIYIYRRNYKLKIEEQINQKESIEKGLQEQGNFLEGKAYDLQEHLEQEEIKSQQLRQKIDEWNNSDLAEYEKRVHEYEKFAARSCERIALKNSTLVQQQIRMNAVPAALASAQNQLIKRFSDQAHARSYIDEITQKLAEE